MYVCMYIRMYVRMYVCVSENHDAMLTYAAERMLTYASVSGLEERAAYRRESRRGLAHRGATSAGARRRRQKRLRLCRVHLHRGLQP
jgi:hypothetical protein